MERPGINPPPRVAVRLSPDPQVCHRDGSAWRRRQIVSWGSRSLAQVSGKNLLGVFPPRRLRVWLWNLEDPQEETERKIQAAAIHYGLTPRISAIGCLWIAAVTSRL